MKKSCEALSVHLINEFKWQAFIKKKIMLKFNTKENVNNCC